MHMTRLLAVGLVGVWAAPLLAAPVNRWVFPSSVHYGPNAAGTGYQISGAIAYQFEPGAAGDAGSVITILINGEPLSWGGGTGGGAGICGPGQPMRIGPGQIIAQLDDGTLLYTCLWFCAGCSPPAGLCTPSQYSITPIPICVCQPFCAVTPPQPSATAPPGTVTVAVGFTAEVPPLPPGTVVTVYVAAAPQAIPEVDTSDDYFLATVSQLLRCGRADLGSQGGTVSADGHLDNNDFAVFITQFFNSQTSADLGAQGGLPVPDGHFDNNDFVVFIDEFFAGC